MPLPPRLRPLGKRALGLCTLAALAGPLSTPRVARAGEGPYSLAEQIGRVLSRIEAEYVDPVDRQRLLEGAAKGMVGELDPHCGYLPPEEYRILLADTEGTFGGIGVEVDFRGDAVIVIAPIEGSPAALLGVRPGDRIEAIDGEPIAGRQATDIIRRMRGREGTRVEVTLRRPGEAAPRRLVLERKVIHVASVASTLLDGGVAYLRVKQFQAGTHAELLAAVAELRKRAAGSGGIASVLLDLRSNPGGLVDEASAVADELLGKGVIYTTRRRGRTVDEVRSA
ncbi:MAG: PDZ domain-containing protein, partial [Deltaproteobacteria bacterium]|nr:PDZ domain-containing protein [Deltaproteobacteria bacterium]